jgi:hypothetical protein
LTRQGMAKLSSEELRQFRTKVSRLKKQGLVSSSLDARSATPTTKTSGKNLSTIVNKFDDVVSGKATAVKVEPGQLRALRKAGFETAHGRVLVPHSATETAKFQGGKVAIKSKTGMERVVLPIEYKNLNQYVQDAKANAVLIDRMKRDNEYFGIRLYGGQRANFYSSIESLIEDLEKYESIASPGTRIDQQEIYKHLEILKLNKAGARRVEQAVHEKPKSKTKSRKHKRGFASRNRDDQRKYRAKLKGSKLKAYRNAAKKRSAKYRRKQKRARKSKSK